MSISRIAGQMLQANLIRDGNNLSFTNTANTAPTLYLDIANTQVGINTNAPTVALQVNGNVIANNISATGNISGTYVLGNGSQLTATRFTVSNWNEGNIISNLISNVQFLRFNANSGITVEDIGNNAALVTLGSSFKTWEVAGQANLVAVGEDVVQFVAGNGMIITTNAVSYPQQIKFTVGGNIYANLVSVVGNVTSGNTNVLGTISALGNIIGANIVTTGNITGANVISANTISALGNVIGGNLTTTGDASVAGNIYGNNLSANTGYFSGNVTVAGTFASTSNIVANSSGIFYGNSVTGNGAIYGGIPAYTLLGSNVVVQFAGNANSYSQINFQNINSGSNASTDYIITASNGNDSSYYTDWGMTSQNHSDPAFFGDTSTKNDAYLYVVANNQAGPSTASGPGNLILGSTNGQIKLFVGNTAQANVIQQISSIGIAVTGVVSASGNIRGANINTVGNITGNNVVANTVSVGTILSNTANGNILITATGTGLTEVTGTSGLVIPYGNNVQRPAPAVEGTLRYNTEGSALEIYDGTAWQAVGKDNYNISSQTIYPDGSSATYTLDQATDAERILVAINGVGQIPLTNYTVAGTQLTMNETPQITDVIEVRFISPTASYGAVNSGVQYDLAYYAETGATVSDAGGNLTWNGANLNVNGNVIVNNILKFANLAMSGGTPMAATDTTIAFKIPIVINGTTYYLALTAAQ